MWKYLKRNGLTLLMVLFIIVILVNPNAKSWVLQQLMRTGFFNAGIEQVDGDAARKPVENLSFKDESGSIVSTQSLEGKVVFINFWASWCPPCRAEMPSINNLYEQFKTHPDIAFLMVNLGETQAKAEQFLKEQDYNFPLYTLNRELPQDIYDGVLPTTLILGKKGYLRYHHKGVADYDSETFFKQIKDLLKE